MGGAKLRRIPPFHPCAEAESGGDGSSKQALKREAKMYERFLLKTAAAMVFVGLTVSIAAADDYKLVEPGKLTIAHSGTGSIIHFVAELFRYQAQIDVVQVPYRGGGPSVLGLLAGDVDMMINDL